MLLESLSETLRQYNQRLGYERGCFEISEKGWHLGKFLGSLILVHV